MQLPQSHNQEGNCEHATDLEKANLKIEELQNEVRSLKDLKQLKADMEFVKTHITEQKLGVY